MPEKASIPEEEECLSPKQVELNVNNCTKHSTHQEYLLQTMWDKHHYFVYGEVLDFYLQQGIEIAHTCTVWHCVQCQGVAEAICGQERTQNSGTSARKKD